MSKMEEGGATLGLKQRVGNRECAMTKPNDYPQVAKSCPGMILFSQTDDLSVPYASLAFVRRPH